MIVRRAEKSDAAAVMRMESAYIDCPWTESQIARAIESDNTIFLTACDPEVCGYVSGDIVLDECEINNIAVDSEYRRRGVGYALMNELIKTLFKIGVTTVFLLVREDNVPAQSLYKKCGFTVVGKRPDYYKGKNALILRLNLR